MVYILLLLHFFFYDIFSMTVSIILPIAIVRTGNIHTHTSEYKKRQKAWDKNPQYTNFCFSLYFLVFKKKISN